MIYDSENPDVNYNDFSYTADPQNHSSFKFNPESIYTDLQREHLADLYGDDGSFDYQTGRQKYHDLWIGKDNSGRYNDFAGAFNNWWKSTGGTGSANDFLKWYNGHVSNLYTGYNHFDTITNDKKTQNASIIGNFNRSHNTIYGNQVFGYNKKAENLFGSNTAVRSIDTSDDLFKMNKDSLLKAAQSLGIGKNGIDVLAGMFEGQDLYKDQKGFYGIKKLTGDTSNPGGNGENIQTPPDNPEGGGGSGTGEGTPPNETPPNETPPGEGTPPGTVTPPGEGTPPGTVTQPYWGTGITSPEGEPEDGSGKGKFLSNIPNILFDPLTISAGQMIGALGLNRRIYNRAKKAPVTLFHPQEDYKWVKGKYRDIQKAIRKGADFRNLVNDNLTADADTNMKYLMKAEEKAQDALDEAYAANDKAVDASREANWEQMVANHKSRHDAAEANRKNINAKKASILDAANERDKANYESIKQFTDEWKQRFWDKWDERQDAIKKSESLAIRNDMLNNPDSYGLDIPDDALDLIRMVMSGAVRYQDLEDVYKKEYQKYAPQFQTAVENAVIKKKTGRDVGIKNIGDYNPYSPEIISNTARGGVLAPDTEKVAIQKLRSKVAEMNAKQKHTDSRLREMKSSLERAQKSMSQYIKGQNSARSK